VQLAVAMHGNELVVHLHCFATT